MSARILAHIAATSATFALMSCGGTPPKPPAPPSAIPSLTTAPADPLAARPDISPLAPFTPPAPAVVPATDGLTVWLIERHAVPLVSLTIAVPAGSSADPPGMEGLAQLTSNMLSEGAGGRDGVQISSAIDALAASLETRVTADGSFVTLTVPKANLVEAFGILGDVVTRPDLTPQAWRQVHAHWQDNLRKRAGNPVQLARIVSNAALYGLNTGYGHPPDGLLGAANRIDLAAVRAFYAAHFRPSEAILAVAGDITADELSALVAGKLGVWRPSGAAAPRGPVEMQLRARSDPPRLVVVDRPGAPQSVISVALPGVAASDPDGPLLDLVATVLGGSFTSRINQNLREDHGWSYGVQAAFSETMGQGSFVVRAAVTADATALALKEIQRELKKMADTGLTPEELEKARAQDRSETLHTYERVRSVSRRLASLFTLGLPPTHDVDVSRLRWNASRERLAVLAKAHVDPEPATIVIIGALQQISPQLAQHGLGTPEIWDEDCHPVVLHGH